MQESFAQYGSSNLGGYHTVTNKFCIYCLCYVIFFATNA